MVLDVTLLNTQHNKVRIKGKVEKSRSSTLLLHLGVVAIEKGAFGSPSATVANVTYFTIYIYILLPGLEHFREGITGCLSRNVKLF